MITFCSGSTNVAHVTVPAAMDLDTYVSNSGFSIIDTLEELSSNQYICLLNPHLDEGWGVQYY